MYCLLEPDIASWPVGFAAPELMGDEAKRRWITGRPLKREPEAQLRVAIERPAGASVPDFLQTGLPFFSERLLELFTASGADNLEAFPAVLCESGGSREWDGYFAVNIVGLVSCADMQRSEYRDPQGARRYSVCFSRLVLDSERLGDWPCFRLLEDVTRILVHERIASRVAESAFSGMRFTKLEGDAR